MSPSFSNILFVNVCVVCSLLRKAEGSGNSATQMASESIRSYRKIPRLFKRFRINVFSSSYFSLIDLLFRPIFNPSQPELHFYLDGLRCFSKNFINFVAQKICILIISIFIVIFIIFPSGLQTFWQSAFAWHFRPFLAEHGHLWTLEPTELPPFSVEWHGTITHLAKVRLQCKVN